MNFIGKKIFVDLNDDIFVFILNARKVCVNLKKKLGYM